MFILMQTEKTANQKIAIAVMQTQKTDKDPANQFKNNLKKHLVRCPMMNANNSKMNLKKQL